MARVYPGGTLYNLLYRDAPSPGRPAKQLSFRAAGMKRGHIVLF